MQGIIIRHHVSFLISTFFTHNAQAPLSTCRSYLCEAIMDPIIFLLVLVACILVLGPGTHATNSFRRRHTRRNQKTIENNAIHKSVKKARLRHHLMTTHHGGVIHSQVHLNHVQEPHHGHDTKHHRWECLCPPSSPFCLQENGMEEST